MKKVQVTWGWEPPRYETRKNGSLRLFYRSEQRTETREHVDEESGETVSEEVTFWVCDALDYEPSETRDLVRVLKGNPYDVECHRWMLKEMIAAYDKSEAVEDFSVQGVHMWLDSNKRTKVRENLETAQQKGEDDVILRDGGYAFPMSVQMGWQLYYAVLDYARATWDVTEIHLATASKLATVDEILAYDYKAGYPEKLAF